MPKPRRSGGRLVMSVPWNSIEPPSGFSRPAIMRKVVVLPQPDGPSSPKNSPWLTSRDTSATARVEPKVRERFLSERKAILQDFHDVTGLTGYVNHEKSCQSRLMFSDLSV